MPTASSPISWSPIVWASLVHLATPPPWWSSPLVDLPYSRAFPLKEPSPPLLGFPNLPVHLACSFADSHGDFHVWPPWGRTFVFPLAVFLMAPAWQATGIQASWGGRQCLHLGSEGPGFPSWPWIYSCEILGKPISILHVSVCVQNQVGVTKKWGDYTFLFCLVVNTCWVCEEMRTVCNR